MFAEGLKLCPQLFCGMLLMTSGPGYHSVYFCGILITLPNRNRSETLFLKMFAEGLKLYPQLLLWYFSNQNNNLKIFCWRQHSQP